MRKIVPIRPSVSGRAADLVQSLITRQGKQSDRAFAARLGVSHNAWSQTRRGLYPLGWSILVGAASLYPDLRPQIAEYMALVGLERGAEARENAS